MVSSVSVCGRLTVLQLKRKYPSEKIEIYCIDMITSVSGTFFQLNLIFIGS